MNNSKLVCSLLLTAIISTTFMEGVGSANNISVNTSDININFDGRQFYMEDSQYAFVYKGATYVPIRFASYALNKNVHWNGIEGIIRIYEGSEIHLNNNLTSLESNFKKNKKIHIRPISIKYIIDGESKTLPAGQYSFIYNNTIYVPIRFLSEAIGVEIEWINKSGNKYLIGKTFAYKESMNTEPTKDHTEESDDNIDPNVNVNEGNLNIGNTDKGNETKLTYSSITSKGETNLNELYSESKSEMWKLASEYLNTTDASTKEKLIGEGYEKLDALTRKFESIVSSIEFELISNGYDTTIVNEYRRVFNNEVEAGKLLVNKLS